MREVTSHLTHHLETPVLRIHVLHEQKAGARRFYQITGFPSDPLNIEFRQGSNRDGITNETLVAILLDRLQGDEPGMRNEVAQECMRIAMVALTVSEEVAAAKDGLDEILRERLKQIEKGYDAAHDDEHGDLALAYNAWELLECYLSGVAGDDPDFSFGLAEKYKNKPLRLLAVAGSLCAAEIDRTNRLIARIAADQDATPENVVEMPAEGSGGVSVFGGVPDAGKSELPTNETPAAETTTEETPA